MVHYITTMQTHIKSIDDINLNYIFYRTTAANIDEEFSDKEHFSALRNVDSLSLLTDKNIKILTAATILSTEIARNNNKEKSSEENKVSLYGCAYSIESDSNIYIKVAMADTPEEANILFDAAIKNIEGATMGMIFKMGHVLFTEYIKSIDKTSFIISVIERKHPFIIVTDKLDSMSEYNRKIYSCTLKNE